MARLPSVDVAGGDSFGGPAASKDAGFRRLFVLVVGTSMKAYASTVATPTNTAWISLNPRAFLVDQPTEVSSIVGRRRTRTVPFAWESGGRSVSKISTLLAMESFQEAEQEPIGEETMMTGSPPAAADQWKQQLLQLAASYDRGFSAPPRIQSKAMQCRRELQEICQVPNANQGMNGGEEGPLVGIWQMIWTTAPDVLVLASSPLSNVGAIYQDLSQPPLGVNIIDLVPKVQSLLPPSVAEQVYTALRAQVYTKTSERSDNSNRVGLVFKRVGLEPLQILGQDDAAWPSWFRQGFPQFQLPRLPESVTGAGYFDVLYLDSDFLIYTQNEPGGWFAFVRVTDTGFSS